MKLRFLILLIVAWGLGAQAQVLMDRKMTCNQPIGSTFSVVSDTLGEVREFRQLIRAMMPLTERFYARGQFKRAESLLETGLALTNVYPEKLDIERRWLLVERGWLLARKALLLDTGFGESKAAILSAESEVTGYDFRYLRARLKTAAGVLAMASSRRENRRDDGIRAAFVESLALRRQLNDCLGVAESLLYVGMVHEQNGARTKAETYFKEAIAVAKLSANNEIGSRESGDVTASHAHLQLGYLLSKQTKRHRDALVHFETALKLRTDAGYLIGLPLAHVALGQFHTGNDDWQAAEPHFEKGYRTALQLGLSRVTLVTLLPIGDLHRQKGEDSKARFYYEQAQALAEDTGFDAALKAAKSRIASLP